MKQKAKRFPGRVDVYYERTGQLWGGRRHKVFCRDCRRAWAEGYITHNGRRRHYDPATPPGCPKCGGLDLAHLPYNAHLPPATGSPGRWKRFYQCYPHLVKS